MHNQIIFTFHYLDLTVFVISRSLTFLPIPPLLQNISSSFPHLILMSFEVDSNYHPDNFIVDYNCPFFWFLNVHLYLIVICFLIIYHHHQINLNILLSFLPLLIIFLKILTLLKSLYLNF